MVNEEFAVGLEVIGPRCTVVVPYFTTSKLEEKIFDLLR